MKLLIVEDEKALCDSMVTHPKQDVLSVIRPMGMGALLEK